MTVRKKNAPKVRNAIDDTIPDQDDDAGASFAERLKDALGEGSNIKLGLYRMSPGSGTQGGWVDDIAPHQIDDIHRFVRDQHGGGQYVIRMMLDGKWFGNYRFLIEGPPKPIALPAAPAAAPASSPDLIERMFSRFEESQRRLIEAIRPVPVDPFDMFSKMAGLINSTKAESPVIGAQQLIEAWNKGLEAAKTQFEMSRGGGETGMMDIVRSAIESFGPALAPAIADAVAKQQHANGATPQANGARAQQVALPARVDAPIDPVKALDENLQQTVQFLVRKAAVNADTLLYAEYTMDNLDPQLVTMLLHTPGILDQLSGQFPGIAQNRGWFDALLKEMVTIWTGEKGATDSSVVGNEPAGATDRHS